MRAAGVASDLLVPLLQSVRLDARRDECVVELGSVPVRAEHDPACVIVVDVWAQEGRGTWSPGLWWPDEREPRWSGEERRLQRDRVALPVHADDDGVERQVRVLARLRPSGPSRAAVAIFSASARFPV